MVDAVRKAVAARRGDETGVFTAMVVLLAPALFLLVGLVVDGGQAVAAHEHATAEAEQAARAGADALSRPTLLKGTIAPDPQGAVAAAEGYMAQTGHPGTATVNGNTISADVASYPVPTTFLGLIGIGAFHVGAHGSAISVTRYRS